MQKYVKLGIKETSSNLRKSDYGLHFWLIYIISFSCLYIKTYQDFISGIPNEEREKIKHEAHNSSLLQRYEQEKRTYYRNLSLLFMLIISAMIALKGFINSDLALLPSPILKSIALAIIALLAATYFSNIKKNIELISTVVYTGLCIGNMAQNLNDQETNFNIMDLFYSANNCFMLERIILLVIPSWLYRTIFTIITVLAKIIIFPRTNITEALISFTLLIGSIYIDFSREEAEIRFSKLLGQDDQGRNEYKEILENAVSEGILVISDDLTHSYFSNTSFQTVIDDTLSLKEMLNLFELRKPSESSQDPTDISFTTLFTILNNKNASSLNGTYYLRYIKPSGLPNAREERIFQVKSIQLTWNGLPSIVLFFYDITQQHITLQSQIAANTNKDRLLATVSHELRTPLNGILGMIQVVLKRIHDQEISQCLRICKNSANLLLSLVNSILDLDQAKANKLKLHIERFNLLELLTEIKCLFEFQCVQKNLFIKFEISQKSPKYVINDKKRLSQILINLIGNALKFTFKGGITIIVGESRDEELIELSVHDTGIGIKDEDRNKLFKLFGRLEQDSSSINKYGVGLGLTISNNLAQLLCGSEAAGGIKVHSEFGKGSTFSFLIRKSLGNAMVSHKEIDLQDSYASVSASFFDELKGIDIKVNNYQTQPFKKYQPFGSAYSQIKPLRAVNLKIDAHMTQRYIADIYRTSASEALQSPVSSYIIPTILIVDDNPFNITVATYLVTGHGFHVKSALYGQAAIDIVLHNDHIVEPIRLILMDSQMPVMDGCETTRILRKMMEEKRIPETPVVALTSSDNQKDREECRKAGMCDYLTKPLTEGNLMRVLKKISC